MLAATVAAIIVLKNGHAWADIQHSAQVACRR